MHRRLPALFLTLARHYLPFKHTKLKVMLVLQLALLPNAEHGDPRILFLPVQGEMRRQILPNNAPTAEAIKNVCSLLEITNNSCG